MLIRKWFCLAPKKKERLKDAIIDYIVDYTKYDIVQKYKSTAGSLEIYPLSGQKGDPVIEDAINFIKQGGNFEFCYDYRNKEGAVIIYKEGWVNDSLSNKLKEVGLAGISIQEIKLAQEFLIAKSYIAKEPPFGTSYRLTEKGKSHYSNGSSFEENYSNKWVSRAAIYLSIASIIISIILAVTND